MLFRKKDVHHSDEVHKKGKRRKLALVGLRDNPHKPWTLYLVVLELKKLKMR